MATRGTKFYVFYWEGKDHDGIDLSSLKSCSSCGKLRDPWRFRLDNVQACLRSCTKEGEIFREEVAEFWCVSPWTIVSYNLAKFAAYLSKRRTKALTEAVVLGTAMSMYQGAPQKLDSGVWVEGFGHHMSWQSWLSWRAGNIRSRAQRNGKKCVVMHLDGAGDELLNHPMPSPAEQEIESVIFILGGPDGIKPGVARELHHILSQKSHAYLKVRLPGGKQHSNVVISDLLMAYDRGSLLHDVQQRLKMGKEGYAEFKDSVSDLMDLIAGGYETHEQAMRMLQKLKALAAGKEDQEVAPPDSQSLSDKEQAADAEESEVEQATPEATPEAPAAVSLIENGWFIEKNAQWPGQANALEVKEVLMHKKTQFQDLLVFASAKHGNVIVLDGVIQITERDEMSYQEMLAHLPMFSADKPAHVLIIGGGDGGVLREVVKHDTVEKVTWCEIDGDVVEAAKKYMPNVAIAVSNPKVDLRVGDGVAFAESSKDNSFDVIIVDSSDPVGPAEKLFSKEFYVNVHRILKPGGVVCSQGECLWLNEARWV
ncbi:SPDSYN2 [Symbiodinium natans]|uniref:SPDSYN2 protein n=1 Tax=Symbiodinium natans TaxID=878477 RepID=A0A812QU02_9DINO|nr:SPDSYN2 [Symbiodinium natans]